MSNEQAEPGVSARFPDLAGKVAIVTGASRGIEAGIGLAVLLFTGSGMMSVLSPASQAGETRHAVFVANGEAKDVISVGKKWQAGKGYLECSGTGNYLFAGKALAAGDAHIRARLALWKVAGSAASFEIDTSHFGFDGGGGQGMFVSGPVFGKLRFIGPFADHVTPRKPFNLEVIRKGEQLKFLIDGREVYKWRDQRRKFGTFALRPWRATMRVYSLSASGQLEKPVIPRSIKMGKYKPFLIPCIDLSEDTERHVIVAQGTPADYKGHPTTLLMPDNKTIFCVYPLGHGGPAAVLRRSDDEGLTWSKPLDVPANWRESNNCPALYLFLGPDGVERLFVFEGNGKMRQSVSSDGGERWSPMRENGLKTTMPFTAIIQLRDGRLMGGWNRGRATWISFSAAGGLTWGPERCIAKATDEFSGAWPCEPGFVRSPDGRQIACLMRENSRQFNAMVMFSNDEGETWTDMKELPRALTGDRHQPRYAHDGRLVIPFRDTAAGSPTRNHFVAWVGTYDDIVNGRPGQYRVKLLHSHAAGDCGYPGLELLPDGTFVATTYVKYRPGPEKQSVVSVRFKLSEIDEMAERLPRKIRLLPPGPGNARNSEGDFVQLKDGRVLFVYAHYFDKGGDVSPACLAGRFSSDGGKTWTRDDLIVVPRQGSDSIRSVSLLRLADGRIALFYLNCTSWPEDQRPWMRISTDEAKTWSDPAQVIPDEDAGYYVTNNDRVVQLKNGRILLPTSLHHDPPEKKFVKYGRIMVYISDDAGKTWRRSKTVRSGERPGGKRILLQEPGIMELKDGRLMMFCRTDMGSQYVSYSSDAGESWSEFGPSNIVSPVSPASIERIPGAGDLLLVWNNHDNVPAEYRGKRSPLNVAVSRDEGKTWENIHVLEDDPGGHYCYTAVEFIGDHVLLAYCAGQRATGGLALTQITRFSLEWLCK